MQELEESLKKAQGLIFDCDGTLVDSLPAYFSAWSNAVAPSGITLDQQWYASRSGQSENVLIDAIEREFDLSLDHADVVRRMRLSYAENYKESLKEISFVANIARRFSGKVPLAVASGGSREIVLQSLETANLLSLFDAVVTFDDVQIPKPAPYIFLRAAYLLRVPADRCLVLEDSPQGLEAAKRADMSAIDVRLFLH